MTLIRLDLSTGMLLDVRRRYWYAAVQIAGRTAWLQYWPRRIRGQRFVTAGTR